MKRSHHLCPLKRVVWTDDFGVVSWYRGGQSEGCARGCNRCTIKCDTRKYKQKLSELLHSMSTLVGLAGFLAASASVDDSSVDKPSGTRFNCCRPSDSIVGSTVCFCTRREIWYVLHRSDDCDSGPAAAPVLLTAHQHRR